MSWERLSDFEQEMYWAVAEEASLAEVARGVTDHGRDGGSFEHGPWEPAACSAHLLRWFDQGFIALYEVGGAVSGSGGRPLVGPDHVLPPDGGRARLRAWDHWFDEDERWALTRLVMTDDGAARLAETAGPAS